MTARNSSAILLQHLALIAGLGMAATSAFAAPQSYGLTCSSGESLKVQISPDRKDVIVREYENGELVGSATLFCVSDVDAGTEVSFGVNAVSECKHSETEAERLKKLRFASPGLDLSGQYEVSLLENGTTGTQLFARISKKSGGSFRIVDTVECDERNPNIKK